MINSNKLYKKIIFLAKNLSILTKEILFPEKCLGCGTIYEKRYLPYLCQNCFNQIKIHSFPFCPVCRRKLPFYVNNKNVVLEIWDCGGQPQFKEARSIYYRKTAGILLCFDLANRKSFEHLSDWLKEITSYGGSPYILLVGTKADLRDKRDVELREIEEFSKKLGVKYIETSSKEGLNINKPFEELAKNLLEKELP